MAMTAVETDAETRLDCGTETDANLAACRLSYLLYLLFFCRLFRTFTFPRFAINSVIDGDLVGKLSSCTLHKTDTQVGGVRD